jgi:hypothetical protein
VWYNGVVQKPNFPQGGAFMNEEIKTQVYVINTAVNRLEGKVKPPKDKMQNLHFVSAIQEIKTALSILKPLVSSED